MQVASRFLAIVVAALFIAAPTAIAGAAFKFDTAACPQMPAPIEELKSARCGRLTVPEDRKQPNGRKIALSVAIIPAASASPRPDPIVWLAGGPGDDAITEVPMALAGNLNRDRDVIFMSQRGTYSAQPSLVCPEVDRVAGAVLDMPFDAPEAETAYAEATAQCRLRLEKLGVAFGAYNTIESSADLEDLRQALGIRQWNVYGISYGTYYALTYMRLYPQGIRAVGIDGIFPPHLAGAVSTWTSVGEGINAVFRACSAQAKCRARYGDIGATFQRLVERYDASPQTVTVNMPGVDGPVKVKISGGMLLEWAVSPGTHTAAQVPAIIDALDRGDATRLATTWAAPRVNPATIGVVSNGLFESVSCGEWVPYESQQSVEAAGQQAFPKIPPSIWRDAPILQFLRSNCKAWNVPPVGSIIRETTTSKIPTLVISAQYDAQTAASFGPLVAKTLANATVVEIPSVAHVAFASPSPAANACAHSIVLDFFENLNAVDTSCAGRVPPTDFEITPR